MHRLNVRVRGRSAEIVQLAGVGGSVTPTGGGMVEYAFHFPSLQAVDAAAERLLSDHRVQSVYGSGW